jgi:MurNAc alpha-1-phosphate uridylyltransferase
MLLAAGEGRRMLPLTQSTPKPLLTVGSDCLAGHQLRKLATAGVREVVINTAYLGDQIEAYFGSGQDYDLSISFSKEPRPLETAGGISRALEHLGAEPFVLVNGDVWCDMDYTQLVSVARALKPADLGALFLVANPEHNPNGDYGLNDGRLCLPDPAKQSYTYSGLAVLRPELIAQYPQRREVFGLKEVFDWALAQQRLSAQLYSGYWLDVGTPQRLQELRAYLGDSMTPSR